MNAKPDQEGFYNITGAQSVIKTRHKIRTSAAIEQNTQWLYSSFSRHIPADSAEIMMKLQNQNTRVVLEYPMILKSRWSNLGIERGRNTHVGERGKKIRLEKGVYKVQELLNIWYLLEERNIKESCNLILSEEDEYYNGMGNIFGEQVRPVVYVKNGTITVIFTISGR